ncbi:MAG: Clp protease N-terminal domain-containing protein [Planctomycetota bacterium]
MRERFSDRARHALALANQEASRLGHGFLAPGHIMLGLIGEGRCVATEALMVLDVNLDRVREQVQSQMDRGQDGGGVGLRPQTKATKQVIESAIRIAREFEHHYVGTEHLVMALLEHDDDIPARALKQQGVSLERLREKVLVLLKTDMEPGHDLAHSRHGNFEWIHQQELAKAFRSARFWRTMILAVDSANRLGAGEVEPEHVLHALLRDESSRVSLLLQEKGITEAWLRERLGGS